jgi:hypothetical protein
MNLEFRDDIMEPNQMDADNFMLLLKNWYTQSNDLINFMMESFSIPAGFGVNSKSKSGTEGDSKSARETIWTAYLKNMDSVLKEYGTNYNDNRQMMENVVNKWKEYQASMSEYFNMFDKSTDEGAAGTTSDIWARWLEYSNTMNSQMLRTFYNINGKSSSSAETNEDGGTDNELHGKAVFPGPGTGGINNLDSTAFDEMDRVVNSYYSELSKELMSTYESVMSQKTSPVDGSSEFIKKWSALYNKFIKELISTDGYNLILNDNLKAGLRTRGQLDEAFENQWKLLGLPTRTDLMELHRELHDMQLKLNRVTKQLDELEIGTGRKKNR